MHYTNFFHTIRSILDTKVMTFGLVLACTAALAAPALAQSETSDVSEMDALPDDSATADTFSFDDEGFEFEKSADELEDSFRKEAFDQALKQLMPLKPAEIRSVLEHYDRTVESTELPVHPYPRPESVVQNISLD